VKDEKKWSLPLLFFSVVDFRKGKNVRKNDIQDSGEQERTMKYFRFSTFVVLLYGFRFHCSSKKDTKPN